MKFKVYMIIIILSISLLSFNGCIDENQQDIDQIDTINIGLTDKIFGFYPFITSYDLSTMEVNFNIWFNKKSMVILMTKSEL